MAADLLRILLIDDDVGSATVLREMLEAGARPHLSPLHVGHAGRLSDAIAALEAEPFDVVLLDLTLPDAEGLAAFAAVRAAAPSAAIIAMVEVQDELLGHRAVQAGAHDYLLKQQAYPVLLARAVRYAIEKQRSTEQAWRDVDFFRHLIENTHDLILLLDEDATIRYASPSIERLGGCRPAEVVGRHVFDFVHQEDMHEALSAFRRTTAAPGVGVSVEFQFRRHDGSWRVLEALTTNLLDSPTVRGVVVNARDVTDRRSAAQALHRLALLDELTGLYNRRGFFTLGAARLKNARRKLHDCELLFIDVNDLKAINDGFGHLEGDRALVEIAALLRATFRESDVVARIGGDEFAVFAVETTDDCSGTLASRLVEKLEELNAREGRRYRLSVSVGSACYNTAHPSTLEALLSEADRGMYRQKRGEAEPPDEP